MTVMAAELGVGVVRGAVCATKFGAILMLDVALEVLEKLRGHARGFGPPIGAGYVTDSGAKARVTKLLDGDVRMDAGERAEGVKHRALALALQRIGVRLQVISCVCGCA
jgi:hypothetical protein